MIDLSYRTRTLRAFALALALGGVAAAAGCGGPDGTAKVEYGVTAQINYQKGSEALADKDWIAASKYFSFVKARFPYSKFAVLAELRLADAELGADHHLAAVDAYKAFIRFHPTHEMTTNGYAAFQIGRAYFEMVPDDFWLLPPAYEKDQSPTTDAHRELGSFLKKYPASTHVADARKLLTRINRRLAEHEMYVAQFYWKRGKAMGAVIRLRRLLDRHAGAGYDEEALYLLGRAYLAVDMRDKAKATWDRLVREHPASGRAAAVRGELQAL